ncbi:MAG: iron complex transport system substrate-binding protein [Cellvibrionaceae bacterium]|jgi:iron complex transport system substrate-binding protein
MKSIVKFLIILLSSTIIIVDSTAVDVKADVSTYINTEGGSLYTVFDYTGEKLTFNKPIKRIVAMAPHIVENIFSAGAGDLLVGVVDYSNYPEAAKNITNVGAIQGSSIESILALNPDLVIGWASGHSSNRYKKLKALGIPVYLDEPKTLNDIAKSIQDIGVLTNRKVTAQKASRDYLRVLGKLREEYYGRPVVDVLYQVWNKPLQTINKNSIISDVINLCGGRNIFADAAVIAPKISVESVLDRNPDVIVASGMGEERPDWLDQWLQWPTIKAVKYQHLFFIHPDLLQRHTVRLLNGAEQLCRKLDGVRNGK